jgi:hypothetical protein
MPIVPHKEHDVVGKKFNNKDTQMIKKKKRTHKHISSEFSKVEFSMNRSAVTLNALGFLKRQITRKNEKMNLLF